MIRQSFLAAVNKFEWFTGFLNGGATPEQSKEAIVTILAPYVYDLDLLRRLAVPVFANEALNVARLLSRPEWASLLDTAFDIRVRAIAADKQRAFEVFRAFELSIREAQRSYGLQVVFEQPKQDLTLEEFAFEMFRITGALVESTIQPFLRELYCLACVARNAPDSPQEVLGADLGQVLAKLDQHISDRNFLAPAPWNVRLSQWRNIAQHHSYVVRAEKVVAQYGRSKSKYQIELTRDELLCIARELIRRLGALKSLVNSLLPIISKSWGSPCPRRQRTPMPSRLTSALRLPPKASPLLSFRIRMVGCMRV